MYISNLPEDQEIEGVFEWGLFGIEVITFGGMSVIFAAFGGAKIKLNLG